MRNTELIKKLADEGFRALGYVLNTLAISTVMIIKSFGELFGSACGAAADYYTWRDLYYWKDKNGHWHRRHYFF